ncbi:transmembrane 4 L6 family member 18 isoform X2 [Thamnophis elegans]|uniref:transmembrane 4 L6 family member 18 isoform X2 n=1 Tax=Thamnophis elegans TaxID=35005 RepID=UPI001378D7EC|nr:transmembrane 4 L6 family member 18 isoform X2 [Thamnophis elegans]
MGLQKCSGCLSCLLIPLALWSIVINILLYFPDGKSSYASSNNHTNYVWHFEGICFSGIMRFISVVLSLLGIAFSGYSLIISALSLVQGPYCKTSAGWEYAFKSTAGSYLMDPTSWSKCTEPAYVVDWNIILLSILIVLSGLQILICLLKIIAELRQILCGNYPIFVQPALI